MEYHVHFEINGKRETVVLEHVLEEYGVSEQEFWCCWISNEPYVEGSGNTADQAINNMIVRSESQRDGYKIHIENLKKKRAV